MKMITQDIALGTTIRCLDGPCGRLSRLVIDAASKRITHLIVERSVGLGAVLVPLDRLAHAVNAALVLNLTVDDLASLPHFGEADYPVPQPEWIERHGYVPDVTRLGPYATSVFAVPPVPSWANQVVREHTRPVLSPSQVPLGRRTRIALGAHLLGHLDHVLLDPDTGAARDLVVRRGHLGHRDVIVPVDWVQAISEEEVLLDADRALLTQMPEYQPALTHEENPTAQQAAHAQAGAPLLESELADAVRLALARDARTAQAALDVSCEGGCIILSGMVGTDVERDAALDVARGATEAAVVLDEMEVSPDAIRRPRLADLGTMIAEAGGLASLRRS
jgi:sporulation protein YlmC with PRC-barrel domain